MFSRNAKMATLAILSVILFTSSKVNALAISNEKAVDDVQGTNYTIKDDAVILHSLFGDIEIPMPDDVKAVHNDRKAANNQNGEKLFERLTLFGNSENAIRSKTYADFFECNEQAQVTLSVHSDNHRLWEAFFKRNSVSDTMAVRYCCNLLEYVDNAEMQLSPECRAAVRIQDHVMTNSEVRYTCRQYEFHTAECFLVRWMYWWIPLVVVLLVILCISLICCAMKSRRNKAYLKARGDEKRVRTSLVNGI